jgi:aminoglycoside phosphotransferase (APT) family kinase protein
LPHSYTNETRGDGRVVVKRYTGPDAAARRARERVMLAKLAGTVPVPPLVDSDSEGALHMRFVAGAHGQELIDAGVAEPVLAACGRMLSRIHQLDLADVLPGEPGPPGAVLVHGDYGPNNVLLDPGTFTVTAVLDWEWARPGYPIEDLAWCEWIVRMHHAAHVSALDELYDAYGLRPSWPKRQAAMVAQCRRLLEMSRRRDADAVQLWQHRLATTESWRE